jgi:DNA-directed RNA polymerase specialized sigma24 family protein
MLRYQKKFVQDMEIEKLSSSRDCEKEIESRDLIRLIFRCQEKKVRDAVYYTYVEGFDQREIQKITGQSPATIRRNLAKFKKYLSSLNADLDLNYGIA